MANCFDQHWSTTGEMIAATRPASLLVIDRNPGVPPALAIATHRPERITVLTEAMASDIAALERHDLAVVANTLEYMEKPAATQLLARLRDVQAGRLLALLPLGHGPPGGQSGWSLGDLLALGMRVLARFARDDGDLLLFHYAITSYKTTPQWFNSRYWAHPERWKP